MPPPFPADAADLCVKCGLCLPHCPSYAQTRHEGDSPRGRIALLQAFTAGQIPAGERLQIHIDGCLGCRACEPVCPARVPYGQILDAGRAALIQARPARWTRLWIGLATHPRLQGLWAQLLRGWQALRPGRWAGRLRLYRAGRLGRLLSLLPDTPASPPTLPACSSPAKAVWLFSGCTGAHLDRRTRDDAEAVLSALGYTVHRVDGHCCGALATHAGLAEQGANQAAALAAHCATAPGRPLLGITTGCSAQLSEHPVLGALSQDLVGFLARRWPENLELPRREERLSLHRPCSQSRVLQQSAAVDALLARLPGREVVELDPAGRCCGAAGHHLLSHPEIADRELPARLDRLAAQAPSVLVSSNIGCSLHLAGGCRRRGETPPPVLHPVSLLAQALAEGSAPAQGD